MPALHKNKHHLVKLTFLLSRLFCSMAVMYFLATRSCQQFVITSNNIINSFFIPGFIIITRAASMVGIPKKIGIPPFPKLSIFETGVKVPQFGST